jgi:hypothetical protein
MPASPSRSRAVLRIAVTAILASGLVSSLACAAQDPNPKSDADIMHGIDQAVLSRANAITRYDVTEHYSIFRNGEATPSAQETVHTTYNRDTGKQYTPIAQSGSALLRRAVMDRVLSGEKEINLPGNREASWFTSKNYEMHPRPGTQERNGHTCLLVDVQPRRKSQHLFNGTLWIDASDYTIVRFEGSPAQSPSWVVGNSSASRDYAKVDGFAMATHAEARSHSFLFGDTLITIDYTDYQIQRSPETSATNR